MRIKRTPKYYDGVISPVKTIQDLLPQVLAGIKIPVSARDLLDFWPEMIGSSMAKFTKATSFIDGILTIVVKSSTLYSLLSQHEKLNLLRKLQKQFPNIEIRNIIFRAG
jgi:hypothetical protein